MTSIGNTAVLAATTGTSTSSIPRAFQITTRSVRRLVHSLRQQSARQRQSVMECRNNAEALTITGIQFAASRINPVETASDIQHETKATSKLTHEHTTASSSSSSFSSTNNLQSSTFAPNSNSNTIGTNLSKPVCFTEVASELDVKQNFIPNAQLSGVAVAVSDALDVRHFRTRSGLHTPLFHHELHREYPLISWLRQQGASFIGKTSVRTPLALNDGCVFGLDKPAAIAIQEKCCHYALSLSLHGPAAIACSAFHDVVAFKPTSQTFGTFMENFKLRIPFMTVGLTAKRVDDLLFLWQTYTAASPNLSKQLDPSTGIPLAKQGKSDVGLRSESTQKDNAKTDSSSSSSASSSKPTLLNEFNLSHPSIDKKNNIYYNNKEKTLKRKHNESIFNYIKRFIHRKTADELEDEMLEGVNLNITDHVTLVNPEASVIGGGNSSPTSTTNISDKRQDNKNKNSNNSEINSETQHRPEFTTTTTTTTATSNDNYSEDVGSATINGSLSNESNTSNSNNNNRKDNNSNNNDDVKEGAGDSSSSNSSSSNTDFVDESEFAKPKYARPEIIDHNPYNYTVKTRRGSKIADIDVGWCDYNAEWNDVDDFTAQGNKPGWLKRMIYGNQQQRQYAGPRVELAIGYPAEWIEKYGKAKYGGDREFHQRLIDSVYFRSALHRNQKLEIVPMAFDFDVQDAVRACVTIANYELYHAFERMFTPHNSSMEKTKDNGTPNQVNNPTTATSSDASSKNTNSTTAEVNQSGEIDTRANTFMAMSGVIEALPPQVLGYFNAGKQISLHDYNTALRIRDDVVRATEEQFQDVDIFVVPLLAAPYESGNIQSMSMILPFHLAGHPMLSVQMDVNFPVVLVGEHGRDAALLEDAFRFLQLVRGASPKWWRQKVFGTEM